MTSLARVWLSHVIMLHGQFTSISRAWHLYGATCRFRVQGRIGFSCWHLQARLLCSKSEKSRIYEETSSDSAPINRTGEGKAPFFSRLKDLAWRFWNGTKGLMSDQKTAVQLALRYDQLNRKEKEFIRNVRRRQTDGRTDRRMDAQTDGRTDRQTDRGRQTDRQTDRQKDRQTQTDREKIKYFSDVSNSLYRQGQMS